MFLEELKCLVRNVKELRVNLLQKYNRILAVTVDAALDIFCFMQNRNAKGICIRKIEIFVPYLF